MAKAPRQARSAPAARTPAPAKAAPADTQPPAPAPVAAAPADAAPPAPAPAAPNPVAPSTVEPADAAADATVWMKLKTGLSGPDFSLAPGDHHQFSIDEAGRLEEAGYAEASDGPAA